MGYKQYKPHPALAPYIDAYWKVTNTKLQPVVNRIMPDGCVDILINTGENFCTENDGFVLKNGAAGLVGTMTRFKDIVQPAKILKEPMAPPFGGYCFLMADMEDNIWEVSWNIFIPLDERGNVITHKPIDHL
jgi:hypothetical protein